MVREIVVKQWLPDVLKDTALSEGEKAAIAAIQDSAVRVTWLPDRVHIRSTRSDMRRLSLESVLLVALGFAAAEFFKGALAEAGKDAWNAAKSVVGDTFRKQGQRSYRLQIKAYLVLDWKDKPVWFLLLQDSCSSTEPPDHLEETCDDALSVLSVRWNEIEARLTEVAAEGPAGRQAFVVSLIEPQNEIFVDRLDRLIEDEREDFEDLLVGQS